MSDKKVGRPRASIKPAAEAAAAAALADPSKTIGAVMAETGLTRGLVRRIADERGVRRRPGRIPGHSPPPPHRKIDLDQLRRLVREHPGASNTELGEMLTPSVTRSGVSYARRTHKI